MKETKVSNLLGPYFDAGYPVVAIETCEEQRLIADCKESFDAVAGIFSIAAAGGLRDEKGQRLIDQASNFTKAFTYISSTAPKESFLIVFDYQHMINSATAYRPLLQALPACKQRGCLIILAAPSWNLPAELKHEIPVIPIPLPSVKELEVPLNTVLESAGEKKKEGREELLSAARGLTIAEAENVFALSSLNSFSRDLVEREKMRLVKSQCMSVEAPMNIDVLGGMGQLKNYIMEEVLPSRDDDQLRVRAVLLVGVPGTGKSLSSKVMASILGWPLVRLDLSAAKGSLVGQSEATLRAALAMADAVAPCVLWLDEIEKAVGGYQSSGITDGGTTLGMVGGLLTWMQEHTSPVTVIATCNDFQKLPPELSRAGRIDEKWFLDLPSDSEREIIAKIHLSRLGCEVKYSTEIVEISKDWTGAEVEQLIKSAARRSKRKLSVGVLNECAQVIIPISKGQSIQNLRNWAQNNLRKANDKDAPPPTGRRMKHGVN